MQMNSYAVADGEGNITQIYSTSKRYIPCGEGVDDLTHYVTDSGHIEQKAAIDCDVAVDGLTATITGLPAGLSVETNGISTVTDTEPLIISYDVPGTYSVQLSGRPGYLETELEVHVDDA